MNPDVSQYAQELMETLNDLYGHTFDFLGEDAIKHKLQQYANDYRAECAQISLK